MAAALFLPLVPLLLGLLSLLLSSSLESAAWTWGVLPAWAILSNLSPAALLLSWHHHHDNDVDDDDGALRRPRVGLVGLLLVVTSLGAVGAAQTVLWSTGSLSLILGVCLPLATGLLLWPSLLLRCLGCGPWLGSWTAAVGLIGACGAGSVVLHLAFLQWEPLEQLAASLLYQATYYLVRLALASLAPARLDMALTFGYVGPSRTYVA